jgi:hypothetical protein
MSAFFSSFISCHCSYQDAYASKKFRDRVTNIFLHFLAVFVVTKMRMQAKSSEIE